MPLTTSYSQDAFKTIRIQNTFTADKKGIASTVTTENSSQEARTDYTYNHKGQVTEEKDYIDITNFVEKQFVYGTSEAPQAQVTERKTVEVRDADGALVDGTDGYPAGILVHKAEYDMRRRVTKQIDANGNETSIVYEPSGRISSVTNPDDSSNTYTYEMLKREHDTVIHTNELGTPIKYTYDKFGNELSAYDMTLPPFPN